MKYSELVKARYSCRKFSDKPVSDEIISNIIETGRLAPTAKNFQPVKIWVFRSENALAKIKACTPFQWMANAQAVIAVGGNSEGAFVRPSDGKNYAEDDACIVATHIMLAIHDLGLGSTWIGMFDAPKAAQLFPDMKGWDLVALFPVGWPADNAVPSERHALRKSVDEMVKYL